MLTPAAVYISNYSLCSTGSQGKTGGQITFPLTLSHIPFNWVSKTGPDRALKLTQGSARYLSTYLFDEGFPLKKLKKGIKS